MILLFIVGQLAEWGFYASISIIAYHFLGYPCVLLGLSLFLSTERDEAVEEFYPPVSLIVPAYNESNVIANKISNVKQITYGGEFECLFVNDGSSDGTGRLIKQHGGEDVSLINFAHRQGKSRAINRAVQEASGDIIVISDAGSRFASGAISELVLPFSDPSVGCVTGRFQYLDSEGASQQSLYWTYESGLRDLEARLGTTVVVNGAIIALRRDDWEDLPESALTDDMVIALRQASRGRRIAYAPGALAFESYQGDLWDEFHRRVRIGVGNFQTMSWFSELLDPRRRLIALEFVSHKILRWGMPAVLLCLLVTNIALVILHGTALYIATLAIQLTGYSSALLGAVSPTARRSRVIAVTTFFVAMNAAFVVAFFHFLHGPSLSIWE